MATYNADLRLNVEISAATKALNKVSDQIDEIRKRLNTRFENKSLNEFNDVLARSKRLLNEVQQGTQEETAAVNAYVRSLNLANAARERQNQLIARQVAEQRRVTPTANAGFGVQGPQLPASARGLSAGKRAESLALGVGFPLLFGGGPGSVLGAAAGSFVGSGFGGQILGGAIGQMLDQFAQGVGKVGGAMRDPIANFKDLADAGLLASKSQEKYIQKLIEAGKTAEASALIQAEITKKIGVQGMKDLQNAGAASDKLNKAMAELGLQMQAAAAGPLAALTSGLAKFIATLNTYGSNAARVTDVRNGLTGADRAAFDKQNAQITDLTRRGLLFGGITPGEASNRQLQLANSFASRAKITPAAAPGTTVESQQARATTQELQKQVELGRANLNLAGLTLEKDGARYVTAAKNVALQELDNKLLEIKNSWIGKIFDKERNLAMIRSANLEYQAKLQQISAQVAQKAIADGNSQLQQEQALYRVRAESLDALVQIQTAQVGEESGLKLKLDLFDKIKNVKLAEFDVEKQIALREAAKNGTLQTTNRVMEARRALLKIMLEIEQLTTEQKQEQLRIDKQLNESNKRSAFAQQIQSVFAQTPISRSPIEQLQFDQATRRATMLNPMYQQQNDLQTRLTDKTLSPESDKAKQLQADLALVTQEIQKMSSALTFVEGQETVWLKQRDSVQSLNESINGVGTAIRDGLGQALIVAITQTENLGQAMQGLAANIAAAVGQMLIMNAIKAGISALAGPDTHGFFSILNGTYKAADGAYWTGGFKAFADGGMVTRPTMGLVGEGGQPEYIIPASKMRGAMNRYAAGARGSAVIPAGNGEGGAGSTATMAPGAIDVRYTVERINSVDYVTADQFQQGMRQAAAQGAAQGEQRTLRRLQNSTGTRRRIGI